MDRLLVLRLASVLVCSVSVAMAAAPEDVPPAHQQKHQLPDSPRHGNYLEPQQDNNGATADPKRKQGAGTTTSRPENIEKSKKVNEKPEAGGVQVNP